MVHAQHDHGHPAANVNVPIRHGYRVTAWPG
jgi:hypothetical protein